MFRAARVALLLLTGTVSCARQGGEGAEQSLPVSGAAGMMPGHVFIDPGPRRDTTIRWVNPLEGDASAIQVGERLYNAFNCGGCHGGTAGAIGPNLQDEDWIYGGEPASIFASIMEGRPNGMPTWRGKIPEDQVWRIVAYLQSLQPAGQRR